MHAKTIVVIGVFLLAVVITLGVLLRRITPSPGRVTTLSEETTTIVAVATSDKDPSTCQFIDDPAERVTCIAKAFPSTSTFLHESQASLARLTLQEATETEDPSLCQTIQDPTILAQCLTRAS